MLCSLALGCATFDPAPLDEAPFRERAQTKTLGGVSVSVSVLGGAETREAFDVSMERKGIQPVWLRIRNDEDVEYIFFTPLALPAIPGTRTWPPTPGRRSGASSSRERWGRRSA